MKRDYWSAVRRFIAAIANVDINEQLVLENEYLREENLVLKQQLERKGQRILLCNAQRIALVEKAMKLGKRLHEVVSIVRPETLLEWNRKLMSKQFDGSANKKLLGRPRIAKTTEDVVLKVARENPRWGYLRIAGTLQNLGIRLSSSTVASIMQQNGLPPAGNRQIQGLTWSKFIKTHLNVLWATDFFTVPVWTRYGLKNFYVLFFIHVISG